MGLSSLKQTARGKNAQVMLLVTASYLLECAAPQNWDRMHCGIDVSKKS